MRSVPEHERITKVPLSGPPSPERIEELNYRYVQADKYETGFRLLSDQAYGLHEFLETGRGFFSIRVGGGKAALSMMIASQFCSDNPGARVIVIVPSSVYRQYLFRDLPWARNHFVIQAPFVGLGKRPPGTRRALSRSGKAGVYVLTYSLLSTRDTQETLEAISPKLIVADEGHMLRGDSAKTKRFWAYVDRAAPGLVPMSGTLTSRSPLEYHRLMRGSLREHSPLPRPAVEAAVWSEALRSRKKGEPPPTRRERGAIEPLVHWARTKWGNEVGGARDAYRLRMHHTPGFVTSGDEELGTSLLIENVPARTPNAELQGMIDKLLEEWEGPGGEVFSHAIEIHSTLQELTTGFYFRRKWPDHPLREQAIEHWEIGQDYHRALREFFKSTRYPRPGLDTPMLVGKHHADKGPVGGWEPLYEAWKLWRSTANDHYPERLSEPVWVDTFKLDAAVAWAKSLPQREGGILWVWHRTVLDMLALKLRTESTRPVLRKIAGADWARDDGSEKCLCVASTGSHHKGRNLQHHTNQMIVQWPRSAPMVEQLLGRCHRTGQTADCLTVRTCLTTDYDHEVLAATLQDTIYDSETFGGQRKLLIAGWDPLPREVPEEELERKGLV